MPSTSAWRLTRVEMVTMRAIPAARARATTASSSPAKSGKSRWQWLSTSMVGNGKFLGETACDAVRGLGSSSGPQTGPQRAPSPHPSQLAADQRQGKGPVVNPIINRRAGASAAFHLAVEFGRGGADDDVALLRDSPLHRHWSSLRLFQRARASCGSRKSGNSSSISSRESAGPSEPSAYNARKHPSPSTMISTGGLSSLTLMLPQRRRLLLIAGGRQPGCSLGGSQSKS